jgi:hypothetical protein
MNRTILTLSLLGTILTSCETMEPTAAETRQTNANIHREQSKLAREAAETRQLADDQVDLAQGLGVGSANSNGLEAEAARNREEADNLDTARRQMGRGAAN